MTNDTGKAMTLEPCPYCGRKDSVFLTRTDFKHNHVVCRKRAATGCGAKGPTQKTPELATMSWNNRAIDTHLATRVTVTYEDVERIAKLLAESHSETWNATDICQTMNGNSPEDMRDGFREDVRLVIDAYTESFVASLPVAKIRDEIVITKDSNGQIVAVTRQDGEGRIIELIAESQCNGKECVTPCTYPCPKNIGGACDGWKWVPVEPTEAMALATEGEAVAWRINGQVADHIVSGLGKLGQTCSKRDAENIRAVLDAMSPLYTSPPRATAVEDITRITQHEVDFQLEQLKSMCSMGVKYQSIIEQCVLVTKVSVDYARRAIDAALAQRGEADNGHDKD